MKTHLRNSIALCLLLFAAALPLAGQWQTRASGTGKSTGEIARILLTNTDSVPLVLAPQTVYIPSDGQHQGYVGRIPGRVLVDAGAQVSISVSGYCIHPNRPPAPAGYELPPLSEWVPVGVAVSVPGNPPPLTKEVYIATATPVDRFSDSQIEVLKTSPVFKPWKKPPAGTLPTWPGSTLPIGGTININKSPEIVAPLIVALVEAVEDAADELIREEKVHTPYSGYSYKERQTLVQHTVWIYMSLLTGDRYSRDDFRNMVDKQVGGTPTLPKEEKENLQTGINEFWNAFEATGVKAKVLVKNANN